MKRVLELNGIEAIDEVMQWMNTAINNYATGYETFEKLLKNGYTILVKIKQISPIHETRHDLWVRLHDGIELRF